MIKKTLFACVFKLKKKLTDGTVYTRKYIQYIMITPICLQTNQDSAGDVVNITLTALIFQKNFLVLNLGWIKL